MIPPRWIDLAVTQPLHTLVTHAGAFHSDEIMAVVLLETFYLARPVRAVDLPAHAATALLGQGKRPALDPPPPFPDGVHDEREPCLLVRTRVPAVLALAQADPTTFVIDVGGAWTPQMLNFDHHQASMRATWPDGTALSSTGLVWRWLAEQGHLAGLEPAVIAELETTLIRPLDAHDNGEALCAAAQVCEGYNRNADATGVQLQQFDKARAFLRDLFDNHLHQARTKIEAMQTLARAWEHAQARGERHVVLDAPLPYPDGTGLLKTLSHGEAELLAIPGHSDRFSLISLPATDRFSSRCPMPEAWRGRMNFEVALDGRRVRLAFAHKTGFMCVIHGSAQDAHAVARHVVAYNRQQG